MKTTTLFYALNALTFATFAVDAAPRESNAQRFARGLPPLPPRRHFGQPKARGATTSSTPFKCETKKNFCCSPLQSVNDPTAANLLRTLGISQSSCGEQIASHCAAAASGDSWCTYSCPPDPSSIHTYLPTSSSPDSQLVKCCGNLAGSNVGIDCTRAQSSTTVTTAHPTSSSPPAHTTTSAHRSDCDDESHGHRRAAPTVAARRGHPRQMVVAAAA
ncbi:hypothetical protein DFH08DRAFT_949412 [Mycena albidolilacea]|uniref:Hydrophobin n=1 Tax=Mycena albidolilacea TaxID=1033008 RepID=A0AAD7AN79_9AGAR|nr:hypothetical protein DFH08DRAFT_949412 [Mycena albidolilacea]